jgi:putative transposase
MFSKGGSMQMAKITRCMNYEIVKPIDCDWNDFEKVLRDLQYAVWKTYNKAVQMTWDFQNFTYSYKQRFGETLKFADLNTGVKAQTSDIYAFVKDEFPHAPSDILGSAIRDAQARFKALRKQILSGEVSIPSFKRDIPIPIRAKMIKLTKGNGKYNVRLTLRAQSYAKERGLTTAINVALTTAGGAKAIIDRLISGEYKLCDSKILRRKKKWYLSLAYQFEKEEVTLDPSNVLGVDLGVVNAAVLAFNNEPTRYYIEGNEILEFRRRIEKRRISLLRQGKYCGEGRKGHGRATRIKPIEKLSDKIANFRATTNHKYAKYIVDMAVKHGCGTIQMEDLTNIRKQDEVFLSNWPYYDLQQKIEQKAEVAGIKVVYIDPKYTSQRCSCCGHIAEGNRKSQADFECTACGYKTHADYNAARNIATPGIEEIIAKELKRKELLRKELA